MESLELLVQFCRMGVEFHDSNADLFVKELLSYHVLDMFAQVHGKGKENNGVAKSNIPYLHYLVGVLLFCRSR
jgi:hypothetical protein